LKETKAQLQLEIGNIQNLKGNAVIYWIVSDSERKLNPPMKILAVNFAISIFPLDDNLVTATFPPVGFEERDEFMLYIRQSQCDLIYAGEFSIKKNMEDLKSLPDSEYYLLNQLLDAYLNHFREKMDHLVLNLSLKEKLFFLKKLVSHFRENLRGKKSKTVIQPERIRKIIVDLKKNFNPFDLENFYELLQLKGIIADEAVELYLKKFIAIHYEDYETAQELTLEIEKAKNQLKF